MNTLLALRSNPPETRFARSGNVSIAYQVAGNGPVDMVLVPGFVSHLELNWQHPTAAAFLGQLASFSRLIMFDKRGTGLSDRSVGLPGLRQRMDDVRAVMDAVGSARAVLLGISEGGSMAALFAATYPQRVSALILYGAIAKGSWAPDYPWGGKADGFEPWYDMWRREWGGPVSIEVWAPSLAQDDRFRQWWARYLREASSPGAVINLFRMNAAIDSRSALAAVTVPTLVVHRAGDRAICVEQGRYLAAHIAGASYVELEGDDHVWYVGDVDSLVREIQKFVMGGRTETPAPEAEAGLSPREMEVAALLAQRLSTAEIAERLFISHHTVSKHLEHIYMKLNASRRSEARRILLAGSRAPFAAPFW